MNSTDINPARARAWREAMGYQQNELAAALGVSRRTVQGMEAGKRADGSSIRPRDWQRYCLLCAGLTSLQGKPVSAWNWRAGED